jgi:ribose transport system ATP-binding protein
LWGGWQTALYHFMVISSINSSLLRVEGLSKSFGTTQALKDATLTLQAGEVHVLLGENGAGKSTLAKIIAGIYRSDRGNLYIDNRLVRINNTKTARKLGIATVFQELSLAVHLSAIDNLFLGWEKAPHPFAPLQRTQESQRGRQILDELAIDIPLHLPVSTLSVAQKQMLEIAKALLQQPRIFIMDEPTSTLTEREKILLFQLVNKLKNNGVAVLYVTHHLQEVFEIGTRVSAMLDGRVHTTVDVNKTLTESDLLGMLTGRNLSMTIARSMPQNTTTVLEVTDLHTPKGCAGVSLQVKQGEIVGVYGVVGCGRESLGRAIVGLVQPSSGTMRLAGQRYNPSQPKDALAKGVGYLPMDRKEAGILAKRPIRENLNLSNLRTFTRFGLLSHQQERSQTTQQLERLQVRYASAEAAITSLSGGNQQKVLFGRTIARMPQLLVLEDPTSGIDMGARLELYRQVQALAEQGMSVLLLSSDLLETTMLCHRLYVMYAGKIVDEFVEPTLEQQEQILAGVLGRQGARSSVNRHTVD